MSEAFQERCPRSRHDTRSMTIGLFSRCLGCSSTFAATAQFPEAFDGIRCLVGPQPVPVPDKKLQWIHDTTRRWDGYLEFQRHPEPMLEWFTKHMS